jgi:transcriptional regulator with XRE-family HTH domain
MDHEPKVLGNVRAGGRQLRVARAYTGLTQQEIAKQADGQILAQQISRFEKGLIEKPAAADLGVLAKVYEVTPNEMFEWYDYWHPTKAEEVAEHADPRVREFLASYERLPADAREDLLNWLHYAMKTAQAKAMATQVEHEVNT